MKSSHLILAEEPLTPNEGEIVALRAIVEGTARSTTIASEA
jgi:hypothetical protein